MIIDKDIIELEIILIGNNNDLNNNMMYSIWYNITQVGDEDMLGNNDEENPKMNHK
jgi:hypothetical protein